MPPSISAFSVTANSGYNSVSVSAADADDIILRRRFAGEEWFTLTRTHTVGSNQIYTDYNVPSGTTAEYEATARDGTGLEVASNIESATQSFTSTFIHKVARGASTNLSGSLLTLLHQEGGAREVGVPANVLLLPALDKPVIEVGSTVERRWNLPLIIADLTTSHRSTLLSFITSHSVVCVRDGRGRIMFGVIQGVRESLNLWGVFPLQVFEVDYSEEVAA